MKFVMNSMLKSSRASFKLPCVAMLSRLLFAVISAFSILLHRLCLQLNKLANVLLS